jgi:hypothetical protein
MLENEALDVRFNCDESQAPTTGLPENAHRHMAKAAAYFLLCKLCVPFPPR